jgi:hypothetical protein
MFTFTVLTLDKILKATEPEAVFGLLEDGSVQHKLDLIRSAHWFSRQGGSRHMRLR